MPINPFPFQTAVGPLQPPIESLELRGAEAGARLGKAVPSTASAIARGVTNAVDAYRKGVESDQRIALNEQQIQAGEQALELAPERAAAEQARLLEERRKYAQAEKLRQEEQELVDTLQQGAPEQIVDTVMSGKYAQVFAKSPKLYEQTVQRAAPHMNSQQRDLFLKNKSNERFDYWARQNQARLQADAQEAENDFLLNSNLLPAAKEALPNLNPIAIARRLEFHPTGTYEVSKGELVYDDEGNPKKGIPDLSLKTYDVFDRETGKLVAPNIPKKEIELLSNYRTKASMVSNSPYMPTPVEDIVRQYTGQGTALYDNAPPSTPRPRGPRGAPRKAVIDRTRSKIGAPVADAPKTVDPIQQLDTNLDKTPVISESGEVDLQQAPQIGVLAAQAISLPTEVTIPRAEAITDVLQKMSDAASVARKAVPVTSEFYGFPATVNVDRAQLNTLAKEAAEAKETLATELLSATWEANKEQLEKAYTAQLKQYLQRTPGLFGSTLISSPPTSAEELYIQRNKGAILGRLDYISRRIQRKAENKRLAIVNSPKGADRIRAFGDR